MSTPTDPEMRLAELFPTVERIFANWADAQIEGTEMSPARVRLLGVLRCKGPQMMSGLGRILGVTARNVTTLVDGLERDKAVRRLPHPTDRRATMVDLTPSGLKTAERLFDPFVRTVSGLFKELPEGDRHELVRLLEAVAAILLRRTKVEE
jgi:DNA-binding MarR family transcriptional regulator